MSGRVFDPADGTSPDPRELGGKAQALARLTSEGWPVPRWICLTAGAMDAHAAAEPSTVVPPEIGAEVRAGLSRAGIADGLVSVRSSAVGEDGVARSFAGQFESVLGVAAADAVALEAAILRVWASAWGGRARAYAGAADRFRMAVVIQRMVDAEVAGVAFSADPLTDDRDSVVISAVYGLGEGLVGGELDADTYRARFRGGAVDAIESRPANKIRALRLAGGWRDVVPPASEAPALKDAEIIEVATRVRELAGRWNRPLDVEWAYAAGPAGRAWWVLQARPITGRAAGAGDRRVWDNSNIAESYNGVTTPLTFSFARSVYAKVYRQFGAVLGATSDELDRFHQVHEHMLGLIRGRVYYNLLNWYRGLAALPGFTWNREFMERMMGVRERMTDAVVSPLEVGRAEDLLRMIRMTWNLLAAHVRHPRAVREFHAHVDGVLREAGQRNLEVASPDELLAALRDLESRLLARWHTPIINDLFAMIWFGTLGRLMARWMPGAPPALINDLLCGEGGMISAEPARRVMALARRVAASPELAELFAGEPDDAAVWRRLGEDARFAGFRGDVGAYLERFGDRCMNELKLETRTLTDDPTVLIRFVRGYVDQGAPDPDAGRAAERKIRDDAEVGVAASLGWVRARVFARVLAQARARVRDRENMRFERTRTFGAVRRIFLAVGTRLLARGSLAAQRDVFWLTREELAAHIEGTGATRDLKALVALRRAEFEGFAREPSPPERFETFGPPGEYVPPVAAATARSGDLAGLGCCPGVVRAPVRVVRDPLAAGALHGHILVAERTDPGWTLIFPACCGLLVERGSLLSHSAIVARELGIPCVVAIPGLMASLTDGDIVEMDGATGVIRRLAV